MVDDVVDRARRERMAELVAWGADPGVVTASLVRTPMQRLTQMESVIRIGMYARAQTPQRNGMTLPMSFAMPFASPLPLFKALEEHRAQVVVVGNLAAVLQGVPCVAYRVILCYAQQQNTIRALWDALQGACQDVQSLALRGARPIREPGMTEVAAQAGETGGPGVVVAGESEQGTPWQTNTPFGFAVFAQRLLQPRARCIGETPYGQVTLVADVPGVGNYGLLAETAPALDLDGIAIRVCSLDLVVQSKRHMQLVGADSAHREDQADLSAYAAEVSGPQALICQGQALDDDLTVNEAGDEFILPFVELTALMLNAQEHPADGSGDSPEIGSDGSDQRGGGRWGRHSHPAEETYPDEALRQALGEEKARTP